MAKHIWAGVYLADTHSRTWQGTLINLDAAPPPYADSHILPLPLAHQDSLSPNDIELALQTMKEAYQDSGSVLLYAESDPTKPVALVIAYFMQVLGLSLADAYTLGANRLFYFRANRQWLAAIIDYFQLPYDISNLNEQFFFSKLLAESNHSIHNITDGIFISGIHSLKRIDAVQALGIQAVLRVDNSTLTQYGQWNEQLFDVLHMPLEDGVVMDGQYLAQGARFIHQQLEADKPVLVHCQAGISRSVTMVLAYLIEYRGMSLPDAFRTVASKRPSAYPHKNLLLSLVRHYQLPYTAEQIIYDNIIANL